MNPLTYNNYFFIGVAGTGMSALAQYASGLGCVVSGSVILKTQVE
jgi:UDP-N-acetylmuramate--alanine ligase